MFFKVFFYSHFSQCFPVDAGVDGDGQEVCVGGRVVGALAQTRWRGRVLPKVIGSGNESSPSVRSRRHDDRIVDERERLILRSPEHTPAPLNELPRVLG